jgi:subtilase family serine protease
MHRYEVNGETHFANATELQVPAGIRDVVLNVRGLNDFRLKPHARKRVVPGYTVGTSGGIMNFLTPLDWATIYDVNPIYTAGYTGAGTYVGVVGQTYAPQSDITNFRTAAGLSTPSFPSLNSCPASSTSSVCYVCIDPTVSHCTGTSAISTAGDLEEADLDIEWSGGIAANATVVYVYAPYSDVSGNGVIDTVTKQYYGVFDALQRAVEDYKVPATGEVLPVISMSYTDCEESFGGANSTYQTLMTNIGTQANSQGQTIVVASGDTGAFGCDLQNDYPANQGVSLGVPVDSPNYTGVGGTTLSGDESDPAGYWNQTLNTVNSALKYIPETAWNDSNTEDALSATSGGVSLYYGQPSWQNGLVSGQTSGRMAPDVAFAASPNHDGYMYCSSEDNSTEYGTTCASGFLSSDGYFFYVGGTSAGTPSFAGILTLLVQKYGNLGNINPTLYALAADATTYKAVFHDITSGNNVVACTVKTSDTGCPSSGEVGYDAATGYDMTTGLGSIDAYALYTALMAATATTAEASPGSVTLGGTTTLTATVSSAASGTITGEVTFTVGSTTLGQAAVTSGVATLPNVEVTTVNGFTSGSDTITASYGGSTLFAGSSGTAGLTVSGSLTTTTVTATPASIALGSSTASQSFTATVTGSGGTPTGTMAFQVGGVTLAAAVALSGGSATLSAIAPSAANGFTVGNDTVTATYTPASDSLNSTSNGTTGLTVTAPAYAITPAVSTVSLSAGGSQHVTVALVATTFKGTVNWTATSNSSAITVNPASGSTTLMANGSGSITLLITSVSTAAKRAPQLPWRVGGMVFGALLAGLPLARRRRAAVVLLTALAILALALAVSCSGGSGSTSTSGNYTVTITGTGGVIASIPVSVQ